MTGSTNLLPPTAATLPEIRVCLRSLRHDDDDHDDALTLLTLIAHLPVI